MSMNFGLVTLISNSAWHEIWARGLVALGAAFVLYLVLKSGLRRFRFKDGDLKAAQLNRRERRRWRSSERRKLREGKMPSKVDPHF